MMGVAHQSDDMSTLGITDGMRRAPQRLSSDAMVAMMCLLFCLLFSVVVMPCCDVLVMQTLDRWALGCMSRFGERLVVAVQMSFIHMSL
jgi:hypothetical protein